MVTESSFKAKWGEAEPVCTGNWFWAESFLAVLFPEKNPSAPEPTKGSDDFVTDSEDDGAKQNGEHGARRDGSRAAGKRGKVGVIPLPVHLGSQPVGVPAISVWEPAEGAKLFRIDFSLCARQWLAYRGVDSCQTIFILAGVVRDVPACTKSSSRVGSCPTPL